MVRWPERDLCSATAMTSLISLMPARTALKETNSELVRRAMSRASVVFPQPGGPQKSMEPRLSFSICTRSDLPGPRSFSWPMNSSRVRGRMRSASGWLAAGTSGSGAGRGNFEKRLTLFRWLRTNRRLDARGGHRVSLTSSFIENDGGRGGRIQRFDAAGHGNADACVGAALDFFGKPGAFVSDEEGHGLAPIDFPRSEQWLFAVARFVNAGSEGANARDLQLREENGKRHAREDRKMQSGASGGAQRFRRERICSTANAGSDGNGASRAEGGSGAQDRSDVAGILHTGEDDEQGSASGIRRAHEIIERSLTRMNQRGDALRVLGVGKAFKEPVGSAQDGESHLRPIDERRETFVVAFAGLAEEHGLHAAAGTERFLDEAYTLDANETALRGQAAAQGDAKLLEPTIVAAGDERGLACGARVTRGFACRCHLRGG